MQITNNYNLPEALVSAIKAFQYNYESTKTNKEKYTVTELLKPSYQRYLQKKHNSEITEDASERIWALMGQAVHAVLNNQTIDNCLSEERLTAEIDGVIISGQMDMYKNKTVDDYKFTSVYNWMFENFDEYEKQLNIYAYLCELTGFPVDRIRVILIFRDWSKKKALYDSNYPQEQVKIVNLKLWNPEKTKEFIIQRIENHKNPTPCTEDERWSTPEKYAVMKNTNKKATKLCNSEQEAKDYVDNLNDTKNKYTIIHRPGENKKCESYCNVNKFCEYYNRGII